MKLREKKRTFAQFAYITETIELKKNRRSEKTKNNKKIKKGLSRVIVHFEIWRFVLCATS